MFIRHSASLLIPLALFAVLSTTTAVGQEARVGRAGNDWPRFLGPNIDSVSRETGILTNWEKTPPKLVWARRLGEGYGIGVTSDGRYYQFDRFDDQARLYCLDAKTGKEVWRHEYPTRYVDLYGYSGGPRCSPLIDEDRVYAFGVEGRLLCLNKVTGKKIWEVDTNKKFGVVQNFFGVGSNPVIHDELLIVMIGGSPADDQFLPPGQLNRVSANETGIVAFDKRTGEVKYKGVNELASYASLTTARIDGRDWCFAFCRGGLIGFDPRNGKVRFNYPWRARVLESVNASTPIVIDDQVLISECYGPGASLLKVKEQGVDVVWADERRSREMSLQTHWNTPIHHEGYVYGSSGRHRSADLRCVRLKDGKVMWTKDGLTRSSLLKVDGHLVCLGEDGELRLLALNPNRYEEVTAMTPSVNGLPLREPCWAAPILSHGLLYVRGDGRLLCYELIPPASVKPANDD